MYRQEKMRILIVIINCCFCAHVCHADGQESALTNFWVTHPPSYQEPSNYLATLRQLGVDNPNSLVPYLKVKGLQESALFSMRLLELETNQLTSATVQKI